MSAERAVQAAVVAALRATPGLTAVFDAPPVRAALPFAQVDDPVATDWSAQGLTGREMRLAVLLADGGERPVRLRVMSDAVDAAVAGIGPALDEGWRVASVVLVRRRIVRAGADRWNAIGDYRVRVWRADG